MSESIGWNVYSGNGEHYSFVEFVPNEPALSAEAAAMADRVEQQLADGGL